MCLSKEEPGHLTPCKSDSKCNAQPKSSGMWALRHGKMKTWLIFRTGLGGTSNSLWVHSTLCVGDSPGDT